MIVHRINRSRGRDTQHPIERFLILRTFIFIIIASSFVVIPSQFFLGSTLAHAVTPTTVTISLENGLSVVPATVPVQIIATVSQPGMVSFINFSNGNQSLCANVATTGSGPNYQAVCSWTPAGTDQGQALIYANFSPTSSSYASSSSSKLTVNITGIGSSSFIAPSITGVSNSGSTTSISFNLGTPALGACGYSSSGPWINIEYSTDGGTTWNDTATDHFYLTASGDYQNLNVSPSPLMISGLAHGTYNFTVREQIYNPTSLCSREYWLVSPSSANGGGSTPFAASAGVAPVTTSAITGITPPVTGGTPVTSTTGTQYNTTISWNPSTSPFPADTVETATITVTPASGYTLNGITSNFFTVESATVTNNAVNTDAASMTVTAVFPATGIAAPAAPTGVSAVADSPTSADVSFTAPVNNGAAITNYTVTSTPGNITASGSSSPVTISGLNPNTAYTFTVTASNSVGTGSASSPSASITTPKAPITNTAITGITIPATGGTPVTSTTGSQYNTSISWNPSGSPFLANTVETATITVTPESGYTLNGISSNVFTVAGASSVSNSAVNSDAASTTVTAVFPATGIAVPGAPTSVSASSVTSTSASISFTAPINNGAAITGYTVTSSPGNITATGASSPISISGLSPYTAYTFTVTATNSVGTGGASTPSASVTTPKAEVSIAAISGITIPATGATPVTSTVSNGQYSSTISWNPSGSTFEANTVETATVTVVPATGYTLNGVNANFFTVAGATGVSNNAVNTDAASMTVTAVFPATGIAVPGAPTAVSASALSSTSVSVAFTAPANNGAVITGYTVTSSPGGITATGTTTPITIAGLSPNTAYTFTVTASNSVGTGNASVSSAPITTPKAAITISSIGGVAAPATGATPVLVATSNGQYSASIVWSPANSPFVASTIETATVTVVPEPGYTLDGITQNFFTIAGATSVSNNAVNSDAASTTVTAVFPATIAIIPVTATVDSGSAALALTSGTSTAFTPISGGGGDGNLTYSITPALPSGMSLNTSTGEITGTPTQTVATTTYTVIVVDGANPANNASATFTLSVGAPATPPIHHILSQPTPASTPSPTPTSEVTPQPTSTPAPVIVPTPTATPTPTPSVTEAPAVAKPAITSAVAQSAQAAIAHAKTIDLAFNSVKTLPSLTASTPVKVILATSASGSGASLEVRVVPEGASSSYLANHVYLVEIKNLTTGAQITKTLEPRASTTTLTLTEVSPVDKYTAVIVADSINTSAPNRDESLISAVALTLTSVGTSMPPTSSSASVTLTQTPNSKDVANPPKIVKFVPKRSTKSKDGTNSATIDLSHLKPGQKIRVILKDVNK